MGKATSTGYAIGPDRLWHATLKRLPDRISARAVEFARLEETLDTGPHPSFILGCLAAASYDVIELAALLSRLGCKAPLVVLTDPLPNPGIVLREVESVAPGLAVHLESQTDLSFLSQLVTRQ